VPHAPTVEEIEEYVQLHAKVAWNAVLGAGFDGVEIHAAKPANGIVMRRHRTGEPEQTENISTRQDENTYDGSSA
jgi:hypothetical protein